LKIIAVTNDQLIVSDLVNRIIAIQHQIDFVILREKSKSDNELFQIITKLKMNGFDMNKIIVHNRADIAFITGITKVQLPSYSLPLKELKLSFPTLSFGQSIHSYEEAKRACANHADWLLYGHIYETNSKPNIRPRGIDELVQIAQHLPIPVYAIGGIKNKHITELKQYKIAGVAMKSTFFKEVVH